MRLQAVYLIHCHDVQWCKVCSLFISGSNKTYSFIVVISSTVKYKSSMLIWVLHVDKMTSTQTFTMARWEIVVKKSNATRQTTDQKQQQRKQKKKENNNKTKNNNNNNNHNDARFEAYLYLAGTRSPHEPGYCACDDRVTYTIPRETSLAASAAVRNSQRCWKKLSWMDWEAPLVSK